MKPRNWSGKALILALFGIAVSGCPGRESAQPSKVESSALQSAVSDAQVRAFYKARQWQPAWDRKSERALLDALGQAVDHGLRSDLFLKGELPADPNAREAALTGVALRYASALARGYVDPTKLGRTYTIPRPKFDAARGLTQAFERGDVAVWLGSLAPQTEEYRALSRAHLRFLKQAAEAKEAQVPAGKAIKPGHRDPRVPQLVSALIANGYLNPPEQDRRSQAPPPQRYRGAMIGAVRQLQADYGLKPDGILGNDTITVLNAGAGYRARQLAVALERLRWLDRDPAPNRIDVNTAASFLDYWRGGALQLQLRVVNGEPGKWTTPEIEAPIFQLVANPYWRVPDRIFEDELSKKSGAYLAANDFAYRDGRLVQLPGEKNSLGRVKFDMADKQQIYLHDTPFKQWFAVGERHRSHGCVRVQNALDFAARLAAENGVLPEFEEALMTGQENYVKLPQPIPVRLMYRTAYWDGARVMFVPDVYGWDDDVARALALERGPPRAAFRRAGEDIGP